MKAQLDLRSVANKNIPMYLHGREVHNELYVHFSTQAHRSIDTSLTVVIQPLIVTQCEGWNMTTEALDTLPWTW